MMPDREVPRYFNNFALFSLLATTSWYKNDEMVDMSYTTSGRESRNMYTFVASSEDNGARFRCEAKNEQIVQPMKTEILLKVQCRLFFFLSFFSRIGQKNEKPSIMSRWREQPSMNQIVFTFKNDNKIFFSLQLPLNL